MPRPPFVAAGEVGRLQLAAFERVLDHPEVKKRTAVVALHHPVHNPRSWLKTALEGLSDAARLLEHMAQLSRGLVLHGHLHRRIHRTHATHTGRLQAVGATSASLHHEEEARMAGFNLYEIGDGGDVVSVEAHVYNPGDARFHVESVPKLV